MARDTEYVDFLDFLDELMRRYGEARHDDVLTLALEISRRFPHRRATGAYIVACGYCLTGAPDNAVRALEESLGEGDWWGPQMLRTDPDLVPLQGRSDFECLVAEAERRRDRAVAGAQPELIVTDPAGRARALLVALHGATSWPVRNFSPYWKAAVSAGLTVAVPQSSQLTTSDGTFGWDDEQLAVNEVADAHAKLVADRPAESIETILGGFSQGGRLAVQWVLAGEPFEARGFVTVAAAVSDGQIDALVDLAEDASARGVRGVFVVGERDWVRPSIERLVQELGDRKVECRVEIAPDVGHSFPSDFDERLRRAIAFVLDEPS